MKINDTFTQYRIGELGAEGDFDCWDICETEEEAMKWLEESCEEYPDCIFMVIKSENTVIGKKINI
jgi:hypothetical protein